MRQGCLLAGGDWSAYGLIACLGLSAKLLGGCREYSIGLRCEIERKDPEKDLITKDPKRSAELAAYFTHAKLQGSHEVLSLRSAMTQFYKLENYATAAIFARRLLEKSQTPAKVSFDNVIL